MPSLKHMVVKLSEMTRHGSVWLLPIGLFKRWKFGRLRKKFGFDPWHLSPRELRVYAMDCIKIVNGRTQGRGAVAEIGCGLGEIIRAIRAEKRYGFDLRADVIEAAKTLDPGHRVQFEARGFEDIAGLTLDYCVTIGFMHGSPAAVWRERYTKLAAANDIRGFVVDSMDEGPKKYCHDFADILPPEYKKVFTSPEYRLKRRIFVYEKIDF